MHTFKWHTKPYRKWFFYISRNHGKTIGWCVIPKSTTEKPDRCADQPRSTRPYVCPPAVLVSYFLLLFPYVLLCSRLCLWCGLQYLSHATLTHLWETSTFQRSSLLSFFIFTPTLSWEMRLTPFIFAWNISTLDYLSKKDMSTICCLFVGNHKFTQFIYKKPTLEHNWFTWIGDEG